MTFAVDLHERAHDGRYAVEGEQVREWEKEATHVLSELLQVLGSIT